MTTARATWVGFLAILLWAVLAALTVGTQPVPPFLLNALTFAVGGLVGLIWVLRTGGLAQLRGVPLRAYVFGTAGLFGYHALYFSALRLAPPAETSLIAYLWPLFIVLLSGLLPGERLRKSHLLGALMAFAGAGVILGGRMGDTFAPGAWMGLGLAFLCAVTWAVYSVGSRWLGTVPTGALAVCCLATALLSLPLHLLLEETAWPATGLGWLAVMALGLGPVGLAFYVWDVGMKRGNIQLLGVCAYAAPLLSTLALVATGMAEPTPMLLVAAVLITAGAALAALGGQAAGGSVA